QPDDHHPKNQKRYESWSVHGDSALLSPRLERPLRRPWLVAKVRAGQRRDAGSDTLPPAAAVGRAAAAVLPALAMVGRVAAAADDDVAGEVFETNAAAGIIQKLRLFADDKLNAGCPGQADLIGQGAGPLDELRQIDAARQAPHLADHEP